MTSLKRFRAFYGAGPLHLLALLASFAIAAAAVVGWFQRPNDVINVLEWFAAAIVLHDLVLLPLYSLLDRIAFGGLANRVRHARTTSLPSLVSPTAYLRIPAILSGLLLLVFLPVIFGLGTQTELSASGIAESGYLARWLLATGIMFALSGVSYAMAVARASGPSEFLDVEPAQVDDDPEPAQVDNDLNPTPVENDPNPAPVADDTEQTVVDPEPTTPNPEPPADAGPPEPPPPAPAD